jgi:glycosyltransferase involved in cell wall biosynthesis
VRIVLVNWAPIRDGAARGGGVNGYAQALGLELVRKGHEVLSLTGGVRYDREGSCRIEEREPWEGIRAFEVVNSPVLAPSLDQFKEPLGEVSAPALERSLADAVRRWRPDVMHWHNIEGFSAGCIGAVRAAAPGMRLVFSLHNYHTICPQVYLMQGHRRPCRNFENGSACVGCVPAADPAAVRAARVDGPPPPEMPRVAPRTPRAEKAIGDPAADPWPPRFVPGRGPHPYYCEDVPAWRPLLNVIELEPASSRAVNAYGRRRAAMIGMLNSCDLVLAVSDFVRRKFISTGVEEDRIRSIHIGSRMAEIAAAFRRDHPPEPLVDSQGRLKRPIRAAFMGYNNWYKGLPMLADSLDLLTPDVLARVHLHVYALEGQQMEAQFRELESRLGGLTFRHGYAYEDIPRLLRGIDLGLVTSVWWDNAPQTVMEFFACGVPVLAAELGGIPDFVREGENGLFFRGNDRWDLARRLAWITGHPGEIPRLSAGVCPPKGMAEHAAELERIYGDRLS